MRTYIYDFAYKLKSDYYVPGDFREFIRRSSHLYRLRFMDLGEYLDWQEWVEDRKN